MKRKAKERIIARFNAALIKFNQGYAGRFVCPTCVTAYAIDALDSITEAHIVPQSAGGKLATLNCRQCNTTSGYRQDKWFGEYLYLRSQNKSLIATRHQTGTFNIEDVRVSGTFAVGADGGTDFYIYRDKTSSLQSHLAPIRQLIKDPSAPLSKLTFAAHLPDGFFDQPWIGIGKVGEELALLACIGDYMVFFPPADAVDFCERLPKDLKGVPLQEGLELRFDERLPFAGPVGVLYENRALVIPDVMRDSRRSNPALLHFSADERVARMLFSISEEQAAHLQGRENVHRVRMTMPRPGELTPP